MFNNLSLHSCVSLARDKLHGARDDMRLCRWVLLKNSLSNALSCSTESQPPAPAAAPSSAASTSKPAPGPPAATDQELETFVFPDGDVFAESFSVSEGHCSPRPMTKEELSSEAEWFDSLLESLTEDSESVALVTVVPADDDEEDEDSDLASLLDLPSSSEDLISSSSLSPESFLLPPSPPLSPYHSPTTPPHNLFTTSLPITYATDLSGEIDALALPDVIEDCSSDSDSESLNTPFTRSTSSLADGHATHVATVRPPMVRIVDQDDHQDHHSNVQYPFEFHVIIPDSFEQEC